MLSRRMLYVFLVLVSLPTIVVGSPKNISIQSRIVKPDGTSLEGNSVQFRFTVTDTVGTCVLFQEDFANKNMTGTKGVINFRLGSGTQAFPGAPLTMDSLFANGSGAALNCQAGGTYTPGNFDKRQVIMQFNDGSGWQTAPSVDIVSVPFSLQSLTAQNLGNYPATAYVRTATIPTCTAGQALFFNGTSLSCVAASAGGGGTVTGVTSANTDIGVTNGTTAPVLALNSGTGPNQIVKLDGSSLLPAVSGVNLTALNATNLGSGTVPAARMPALTGDVTMTAGTTTTAISGLARSKLAAGTNNHVLINDGSGGVSSEAQLAVSRGGTAASSFAGNAVILSNLTGSALTALNCSNGQVIKFDASGYAGCGSDGAGQWTTATNDIYYNTGNVGIGTSTPSSPLHISSTVASGFLSQTYGVSGSSGDLVTTSGMSQYTARSSTHTDRELRFQVFSDGHTYFGPMVMSGTAAANLVMRTGNDGGTSTGEIQFVTGTTQKMVVASGGNVGIGTSSPNSKLDVNGSVNIGSNLASFTGSFDLVVNSATGGIILNRTAAEPFIRLTQAGSGGGQIRGLPGTGLRFTDTDSNVEWARISSVGNVGIGNAAPTAKLHVTGQIVSGQNTVATGATVDFATGNVQIVQAPGAAAITLNNMVDGGAYTLIITDTTARTYTFTNCTTSRYVPANENTSGRTVFSILKTTEGGTVNCYISWVPGF